MNQPAVRYPGTPDVINGNGAVAYVMRHVCGGVIGYPITPSTEISELFEAARAEGQLNVWGRHAFFVETEGEHSAQSGAMGAALTGGLYVSNASSSQGILYGLESHYATVGKRIGGFVLQVAARVVSRTSLNVMAGHDDVYSLIPAGYTILFGSNPQEAADLAAISYRVSSLSLIPVANSMDGFATSHVMSEVLLPEPELLRDYLGDPTSRIPCPTAAQEMLYGAKGRVFQLGQYLARRADAFAPGAADALRAQLAAAAEAIEADNDGALVAQTLALVPEALHEQWRRQWINAWQKGTRQLVPAQVDPNHPGSTGPLQNQPDFQAGSADRIAHFHNAVPGIVRQAMSEYSALTGRTYEPVTAYDCADADHIMVGIGSITDDVRAVLPYLREQGLKVGVVSIKLLNPFPEAELIAAISHAKSVTVLERSDLMSLTPLVNQALARARANGESPNAEPYPGLGRIYTIPRVATAIFGLGGHDVQPRHLIAAYKAMASGELAGLVYLGSQFFVDNPTPAVAALQDKMRAAYPETAAMALKTEPNPPGLLPAEAIRIRFHSVGGYGTVATGKLLTDILSGMLAMHSKSAPKYGSEKSGAATNYYITLSPEPVLITNAELEDVEVVVAPDHMVFAHSNPLKGLVDGGTLIMQSGKSPLDVWRSLPPFARRTIRERKIQFLVIDAFKVAQKHAPTPELETRMMGIAFIGAIIGNVSRVASRAGGDVEALVHHELDKKFGRRGGTVVESNMAVVRDGMKAQLVDYDDPAFVAADAEPAVRGHGALTPAMVPQLSRPGPTALFDPEYFETTMAQPFRDGTIGEAPVFPGAGMFLPPGSGAAKNKGLFRREVPVFDPSACTACMECTLACPDNAIPNTVHEVGDLLGRAIDAAVADGPARQAARGQVPAWADAVRQALRADSAADLVGAAKASLPAVLAEQADQVVAALAAFPVARPRPVFDAPEKAEPGTGGLYSVVIDPWKCSGCLQCVEVCGPKSLTTTVQDDALLDQMESAFARLVELPSTPKRFFADAIAPGGDAKRVLLDRAAYYSLVGGHGACKGCGEVTATHLVTAMSHMLGEQRRGEHIAELEGLIGRLRTLLETLTDGDRFARVAGAIAELEHRLYLYESGPTGNGTASTVIANSTGCSSVYSSTQPFTPFIDPWVNGLFQDAQPLASGIYEGLVAAVVDEVKALRVAKLELAGAYDASADAELATLSWRDFTDAERALVPVVLTIGGDGAAFDIGFGAMSRVLAGGTPIKCFVLDTGVYSNTGGQASTASFQGQDSDLARHGRAHHGKRETRKELGLLAAFHPGVYACSTSTAYHGHFLKATMDMLGYEDGTSLMVTYTPCDTENGLPDDMANARARLAVESRMAPLFIHDPRVGESLSERFSLDGNPDVAALWTTQALPYVDESGQTKLLTQPLTPADFAVGEVRFAKQFRAVTDEEAASAMPIADYVELPEAQRAGRVPVIKTTDSSGRLRTLVCAPGIVALVEDRRHNWLTLKYLAGEGVAELGAAHQAELDALTKQCRDAADAREASLDAIAAAMADLATARKAPTDADFAAKIGGAIGAPAAPAPAPAQAPAPAAPAETERPIWLADADLPKCNDCATCYQELPSLFEKAAIIVDGVPKTVGHLRPGALDGLEITPELATRIARVKATCDAEIIR